MEEARAETEARPRRVLSKSELEQLAHRKSLLVARSDIVTRLESTRHPRYRAQLELALEHLDSQLKEL